MTISTTTFKNIYACNGSTTVFPYTFKIFEDDQLEVILYTIADGTETVLTLTTEYTVSGAGNPSGGNVTTIATYSSLYQLIIRRALDAVQETDYVENDPFPAEAHEDALDYLTMLIQQQQEILDRVIIQDSSATTPLDFPEPSAGSIIGWNAAGTALQNDPPFSSLTQVDLAATPDFLGAASGDGVLRTGALMTYVDGGDFVTLNVNEAALTHDNIIAGTIASHDTSATGAELDTLTDGSIADALHTHTGIAIDHSLDEAYNDGSTITQDAGSIIINSSIANHSLNINQTTNLGASQRALYVYSDFAQVSASQLFMVRQDNASSTADAAMIDNDGTGICLTVRQDGVLAANKHGLYVYTNAAQVNDVLFELHSDNASSTARLAYFINDGTGDALRITQVGTLANGNNALYLYSNAAQTNDAQLLEIVQDNASSTSRVVQIQNDGTGDGMRIEQVGVLAGSKHGLFVYSAATQINSPLAYFQQAGGSSTQDCVYINNNGDGDALGIIAQAGSGRVVDITNTGGDYGIYILQNAALLTNRNAIKVSASAAQTNSGAYLLNLDSTNASSDQPVFYLNNQGTAAASQIINSGNNGTHLRLTGDPVVAAPVDGDLWYTGTNLNFYDGSSTTDLLAGGGGGGAGMSYDVTQASHGFSVGDWLYLNGAVYTLADATDAVTGEVVGVVSAVGGVNDFTIQMGGRITGLAGLTAGTVYFLSETAGQITSTEPTSEGAVSKPVLIADGTTTGYIFNLRGVEISASAGSKGGTFVNGDLTAGVLTVNHAIGHKVCTVVVADNNDNVIVPDDITYTDTNNLDIDLSSYGAITGTWTYFIVGENTSIDPTSWRTAALQYIIDGSGVVITTGVKGDLEVPFDCTIDRVTMLADQSGSIVVDIWKDTYANYPPDNADSITAAAVPTISAAVKSQDATLTGWTTTVSAGDTLRFNVDSCSTITRCTISLKITRT